MSIQVALAGNPNCGKTTLFNGLTGATQYVGNWPGVTVEKKKESIRKIKILKLPIYQVFIHYHHTLWKKLYLVNFY